MYRNSCREKVIALPSTTNSLDLKLRLYIGLDIQFVLGLFNRLIDEDSELFNQMLSPMSVSFTVAMVCN